MTRTLPPTPTPASAWVLLGVAIGMLATAAGFALLVMKGWVG